MKKKAQNGKASSKRMPTPQSPVVDDELRRDAEELAVLEGRWKILGDAKPPTIRPKKYQYVDELVRLQFELIKLQEWVRLQGLKVFVLFEGATPPAREASSSASPKASIPVSAGSLLSVADRARTDKWYFQRYVADLPAAGEIVLFDRSWYNRAGVEHVMGFCSEEEYQEFLRTCPQFEKMLIRSGIILVKYWFSVSDEEQERRFQERMQGSDQALEAQPDGLGIAQAWVEYSRAKDVMFAHTDRSKTPWHVVKADDKKCARLNCIRHLLRQIPYQDMRPVEIELPPRQPDTGYKRPKKSSQRWVDQLY